MAGSFTHIFPDSSDDVTYKVSVIDGNENPDYIRGDILLTVGYREAVASVGFTGDVYILRQISEALAEACNALEQAGKPVRITVPEVQTEEKVQMTHFCCYGFGLWAWGEAAPMGPLDALDGMPTLPCPVCGANANPLKEVP